MNMNEVLMQREQISALADGQLRGGEFAAAVEAASTDEDARASWHLYHLVGDVLRSGELAACGRDRAFVARLRQRLQAEAPQPLARAGADEAIQIVARSPRPSLAQTPWQDGEPAANASLFRWKLVAALASLAAMATVSWTLLGVSGQGPQGSQLAQFAPGAAAPLVALPSEARAAAGDTPLIMRDPRLDELLAAHRQFGGTSALQNPAGFLRNATFEGASR